MRPTNLTFVEGHETLETLNKTNVEGSMRKEPKSQSVIRTRRIIGRRLSSP